MKPDDLLELMGSVDDYFIEDAANHLECSPRLTVQRLMKPAAAAAVIGVVSLSVFVIAGVIRDGIAQQNPPAGYTETAQSDAGTEETISTMERNTEQTQETLPTDLFAEVTVTTTTTVTTVTDITTEPPETLTVPANMEMPDASLQQGIHDRFLVNWMSESGVLAVTVDQAGCYDNIIDAGLNYDDMTTWFKDRVAYSKGHASGTDADGNQFERIEIFEYEDQSITQIKNLMPDCKFVKLTVTVENLNAVSSGYRWNGVQLPDGSTIDDYAQEDDFDVRMFSFFIPHNPEQKSKYNAGFTSSPAYFSLEGQLYDDTMRRALFRVSAGERVTFEIGGFLPAEQGVPYVDSTDCGYEIGTNLVPYYCFGSGSVARPHVELHFTE